MPQAKKKPVRRRAATADDTVQAAVREPVLRCTALRKTFGDRVAVDDVSFEIAPGETYGLLGPNGAGKTTTVSMICGLRDRDAGEVVVAGHPVDGDATKAKAAI